MPRRSISAAIVLACADGVSLLPGPRPDQPKPGPVEEQHLGTALKQGSERQHLVPEIGAGAVNEDDRRQVGIGGSRNVDVVDASTVDVGEIADRRVAALDQPRTGAGDAGKGEHKRHEEGERGIDKVHGRRYGPERN